MNLEPQIRLLGDAPLSPRPFGTYAKKGEKSMRERNHIVRVHLNDRELAHLEKCLSKTHWGKEAFLRAAIQGTGIATKPPEDCQEIIDRLREIGNRLNVLPLQVAKLSTEEKEVLSKATREIWRLYGLVQDAFLPPYRYHMRTVIRMGGKEE